MQGDVPDRNEPGAENATRSAATTPDSSDAQSPADPTARGPAKPAHEPGGGASPSRRAAGQIRGAGQGERRVEDNPPHPVRVQVADHELIRPIGRGSYGEVWLARNVMGTYRAVKIVSRASFESERPFEREFRGIQKFEAVSLSHESQVHILHVGRNDAEGYFFYVMELADDAGREQQKRSDGVVE